MSLRRWCRPLFVAALVVAGGLSKAVASAPTPASASGTSLSYLKPLGPRRCVWVRQPLPSGEPMVIPFDASCLSSSSSWSPDGSEGVIFNAPAGEGSPPPRGWRVDFATKRLKPMDLSGLRGALRELVGASKPRILISGVAFDAQGRLVAFAVVSGGGWRETAFAFRREGSDWKRIETKVVAEVAEVEPGAPVLETVRALPDPRKSFELYPPGLPATEETVRKLGAALPGQDLSGQWMSWSLPGGTLHYRSQHDLDDTWFPSSPMRWEQDGKLVALEGLTEKPGEHIGFQLREGLLLVVQFDSRSVHVFDTRTKKSLVSLKGVDAPTFWPEATSGVTQD